MRSLSLLFLLTVIVTSCTPTYKFKLSVYNATQDSISSIGIQRGYTINPNNQPNLISTNVLQPNKEYKRDKKIKLRKGQSLFFYVSSDNTDGMVYNGFHRFDENEGDYRYPISRVDTSKAYTEFDQIKSKLEKIGISDIDKGSRIKMEIVTSDISNIADYLPGIMIVDTTKIKNNIIPDNSLSRSYYRPRELGIIPRPFVISGNTITDDLTIESDGTLNSQFSFPLASNLNLDISNKGFYKVRLSVKNAGWIPVTADNLNSPIESIFKLDSLGKISTLIDMYEKLKNKNNRLFTVEEGFIFSELISQTAQYTENDVAYEGNYASVITSKGGYVRSDRSDFIDSRPTTLVYVSLTNDKTEVVKKVLKDVLVKNFIAKDLLEEEGDEAIIKALGPDELENVNELETDELKVKITELENQISRAKGQLGQISINIPDGASFEFVLKSLAENERVPIDFTPCGTAALKQILESGNLSAGSTDILMKQVRYRMVDKEQMKKVSVEYVKNEEVYRITCN